MAAEAEIKSLSGDEQQIMVNLLVERLASEGLRTICIAYKDFVFGLYLNSV